MPATTKTAEAKATTYEDAITARARDIAKRLPGGELFLSLGSTNRGSVLQASVGIYPQGMSRGSAKHLYGPTFTDVLDRAESWIDANAAVTRNAAIRKMAMAIIGLTDEHGSCTLRDLSRQFDPAIIVAYREDALARATEMAGNAPFSIVGEG